MSDKGRSWIGWIGEVLLGKVATLVLATLALAVGLSTFIILARGTPFGIEPASASGWCWPISSVLLLLGAVLAGRLTRVWVDRRRGSAGSRLHVRLVLLFSGVAVRRPSWSPCFAVAFFQFGIQAWFNDPVRAAINESLQVSRGYVEEHRNNIRSVALEMANDLAAGRRFLAAARRRSPRCWTTQTTLRGLTRR